MSEVSKMTAYPTDKLEQTSRTFCPLDVLPSRGSKACRKKCPTTVSNHMECHDRERERESTGLMWPFSSHFRAFQVVPSAIMRVLPKRPEMSRNCLPTESKEECPKIYHFAPHGNQVERQHTIMYTQIKGHHFAWSRCTHVVLRLSLRTCTPDHV